MENQKPSRPRFTHTPEPTRLAAVPANANDRRRSGLIPLRIGASRIMRGRDGSRRQHTALELRVEAERAQRDGRELTVGVVCFECGRTYTSDEDFKADHQLTTEAYVKNAEAHTFAYWCEDKADPKSMESIATLSAEVKALEMAIKNANEKLAKCEDVEVTMRERKRVEEIKGMAADARARRQAEEDNIIGLLSDVA